MDLGVGPFEGGDHRPEMQRWMVELLGCDRTRNFFLTSLILWQENMENIWINHFCGVLFSNRPMYFALFISCKDLAITNSGYSDAKVAIFCTKTTNAAEHCQSSIPGTFQKRNKPNPSNEHMLLNPNSGLFASLYLLVSVVCHSLAIF